MEDTRFRKEFIRKKKKIRRVSFELKILKEKKQTIAKDYKGTGFTKLAQ
jgi:hypothetical protein